MCVCVCVCVHACICLFIGCRTLHTLNFTLTSVQFSRSVVSDSLLSHGLQHARLPCPSSTPRACSNLMSIKLVMPSNHLILYCPLPLLPSIFPSIRVFSNESVLRIRWPKYWSFSFSISPSNEYLGLISFAAAAAKSLQSCPTLCDPIDGSPPGPAVPGILQARTLEWVAISFSNAWKEKWEWSRSVVSNS